MEQLDAMAPMGYSVGLHVRFATPTYLRSTYPQEWQDIYVSNSYGLRDPLVFWGISRTGVTRWSETRMPDPFGILEAAKTYGLLYGAVASYGAITSRSMVGLARQDREFTDEELARLDAVTRDLHELAGPPEDLPAPLVEALRLAERKQARSADAGDAIPEVELDARLGEARDLLGARTTAEAIRMARDHRLL